jgi:hypothetical protein
MANHNVFLCFLVCDIHDIKACSPAFSFCFHETSIAVSEIKKRRGGATFSIIGLVFKRLASMCT